MKRKKNHPNRKARLQKEYEYIINEAPHTPRISIIEDENEVPPSKYLVSLRIKSLLNVEDSQKTYAETFKLRVKLPKGYPKEAPEFVFEGHVPFHPHVYTPQSLLDRFKAVISSTEPVWINPLGYNSEERLFDQILRIAKSLQFHPDYIIPEVSAEAIGNPQAMEWYKITLFQNREEFPIDSRALISNRSDEESPMPPQTKPPKSKKFVIKEQTAYEPKKKSFQINQRDNSQENEIENATRDENIS